MPDIDGKRMHADVVEQANIARRYRDQGHPKFWGRITGTSADAEGAAWMLAKFKAAGLTDVRASRSTSARNGFRSPGRSASRAAARPSCSTRPSRTTRRLARRRRDWIVEAVYVGLGCEADFAGRDVKGKAVFVFSMLGAPEERAVRRAADKGAAAVFEVDMLPGNMRYQAYPSGTKVPVFTVGHNDGVAAREVIAAMPPGQSARVKVKLSVERVPNLKTALIWGTLPGATDETIYIMAHRDGWFDASGDNASGVASMIELAGHYGKMPQAQRRRTMIFVALDGHHNYGTEGAAVGN